VILHFQRCLFHVVNPSRISAPMPPTRNDRRGEVPLACNFDRRIAQAKAAIIFALALGAACGAVAQSSVQNVPNAMQGFSQNRDQPVRIEAATLEMLDRKKEATFSGNVKVVQGDTTMTSSTLVVFYESSPAPGAAPAGGGTKASTAAKDAPPMQSSTPGPGGASSIKRLEAQGNVVVTQKDQIVTGDTAVFEAKTNLITMLGEVVVTQCKNVLHGDRLLVDMTTGISRLESNKGKIRGFFDQSSDSSCSMPSVLPAPSATGSKK
jgi:lipopolysaccharide export system protein LptA